MFKKNKTNIAVVLLGKCRSTWFATIFEHQPIYFAEIPMIL